MSQQFGSDKKMHLAQRNKTYRLIDDDGTILMICSNPLICKHFAKELVNERVNPRQKGLPSKQKTDGMERTSDDGSGDRSNHRSTLQNG